MLPPVSACEPLEIKPAIRCSMPVSSSNANLLPDQEEILTVLAACQRQRQKNRTQIVSVSLEIPPVDPLLALDALSQPSRMRFYWQKGTNSIAAVGAAVQFGVKKGRNGEGRFAGARDFITACLAHTVADGALHLPFAGPHFFSAFTFFETTDPAEAAPFPPATVFLPRWQVARCDNCCVLVANFPVSAEDNIELLSWKIWQKVNQINGAKKFRLFTEGNGNGTAALRKNWGEVANPENFQNAVLSALGEIGENKLQKIVLAHAVDVVKEGAFDPIASLQNLRQLYPDCYIFATSNGKGGHFIGASPERLLLIRDRHLVTDALAGSAARGVTPEADADLARSLLNSDKEQREHQFVIDFIADRLSHLGLTVRFSPGVRLRQLSNIQHLWTPMGATVPPEVHPLEILAQLHPTPAVAGVPRDIACAEIRRHEGFDRSLYAAPLGWLDARGNCEFIVGIRSALIEGNRARLYAGAGIVAGSDPDQELAEIQLKLKALLKSLV